MPDHATEFNSKPGLTVPECLQPSAKYEEWQSLVSAEILDIATGFTRQFGVDLEVSALSVLAAAAQALGAAHQVELPHTRLTAPFNVLILTPESEPLWTGVPMRFLRDGLEDYLIEHYVGQNTESEQHLKAALDTRERIAQSRTLARELLAGRTMTTVYRESAVGPFVACPFDRCVTLATPRQGLLRTTAKLSAVQKLKLEDALLGGEPLSSDATTGAFAMPSFFWHQLDAKAGEFFRQNSWLRRLPFLLLRTEDCGFPNLDAGCDAARAFHKIGQQFFAQRIRLSPRSKVLQLDAENGKPAMEFLHAAQQSNSKSTEPMPLRWVAELGLKFALVQMGFEKIDKLSTKLVKRSLELAKHFTRVHLINLAAFDSSFAAENAATADLTGRERKVYLKICGSEGISPAELRRGIRDMSASERDEIVARLISLGLIRVEGGRLLQAAT